MGLPVAWVLLITRAINIIPTKGNVTCSAFLYCAHYGIWLGLGLVGFLWLSCVRVALSMPSWSVPAGIMSPACSLVTHQDCCLCATNHCGTCTVISALLVQHIWLALSSLSGEELEKPVPGETDLPAEEKRETWVRSTCVSILNLPLLGTWPWASGLLQQTCNCLSTL